MKSSKVEQAINKQINAELYSSYLYLSMAAFFESHDQQGFARWFRLQADEEHAHAMKFFDYLHTIGGKVTLSKIEGPKTNWDTFLSVFQETSKHEQEVTKSINDLVDLAIAEKDHATVNFLQWFVSEQVEEEATAEQNVRKMEMIGDSKSGLYMLNRELGSRVSE